MNTEIVIPGIDREDVGTLLNVRTFKQYCAMIQDIVSGKCTFCHLDENLNKVIRTSGEWRLWENPFPHKHTAKHFVMAPTRHITHLNQMTSGDYDNLWILVDSTVNPEVGGMDIAGGALAIRFGDPNLNAGSVRHIHANIIMPDGTGRVQITLAKEPEEIEEKKKILQVFEKLRQGCPTRQLSPEELDLIKGRME